jgi:hypothetical protein
MAVQAVADMVVPAVPVLRCLLRINDFLGEKIGYVADNSYICDIFFCY